MLRRAFIDLLSAVVLFTIHNTAEVRYCTAILLACSALEFH
jgi:hypothetical protein